MVIRVTSEVETALNREAQRRGTTPEQLASESLERLFLQPRASEAGDASLFDYLLGYVGVVEGTEEALSENCGRRFAEALAAKHEQGCP
jgi:hypothetical protein